MVRRVVNLFYQEVTGLHQAAYVLALFAIGSQMLALVRDRLLAHAFGAGIELDLYYAAFKLPDLLFVVFSSVLSVYVLMPFVARARTEQGSLAAANQLGQVFTAFLLLYSIVAGVLFVGAPYIVPLLFPGFLADTDTLVLLLRILLLQPLLLGISSLFGVVTQLHHRFVVYALSPLVYNLGIIIGVVLLFPWLGLSGLVWGVVAGALGHLLIQWPLVRSSDLRFGVVQQVSWSFLRSVVRVALPRSLTLSLSQLVMLVLVSMASTMAVGSVSVLQFAFNLQSVPLAIVGVSYSVAAFPVLTELAAKQQYREFCAHIMTALRHIVFWSVPIIILMIILRAHLVRVLLGTGAFDWDATRLTAAILALFVLSLVAQAVNLLVVRAFYAAGDTRVPFWVALISNAVSIVLAYGLYQYILAHQAVLSHIASLLRIAEVPGVEVIALPFGYSVGMLLQSGLLLLAARHRFGLPLRWLIPHGARAIMAGLVGGVTAYATLNFVVSGINSETFIGIFIQGLLGGVAGIVGVVVAYFAMRSSELHEVYAALEARLFKTDVVAPEKDLL